MSDISFSKLADLSSPILAQTCAAGKTIPKARFEFFREPHTGSTAGHVAGYDGKHWVSDFVQRDFWAGKEYRKERPHYAVYRY
jgi:hypothetical protein